MKSQIAWSLPVSLLMVCGMIGCGAKPQPTAEVEEPAAGAEDNRLHEEVNRMNSTLSPLAESRFDSAHATAREETRAKPLGGPIVGVWKNEQMVFSMEFKDDGTMTLASSGLSPSPGTWKVTSSDGDRVTITTETKQGMYTFEEVNKGGNAKQAGTMTVKMDFEFVFMTDDQADVKQLNPEYPEQRLELTLNRVH